MMTFPTSMPPQLVSRAQTGDVPVTCDCGTSFIWRAGQALPPCPTCGADGAAAVPPAAPIILTSDPLPTDTLQGLAQFDRAIQAVAPRSNPMAITKAPLLSASLRDEISSLKRDVEAAQSDVGSAIADMRDSVVSATDVAHQLRQEAADLRAAVGLNTNGPEK